MLAASAIFRQRMTNEYIAQLSAGLAIGFGTIGLVMDVSPLSAANWTTIVPGGAILVGIATLYKVRER
jgi:hypothetical protein